MSGLHEAAAERDWWCRCRHRRRIDGRQHFHSGQFVRGSIFNGGQPGYGWEHIVGRYFVNGWPSRNGREPCQRWRPYNGWRCVCGCKLVHGWRHQHFEHMTPTLSHLIDACREALLLSIGVSLPFVAVAALVGLLVALVQAATRVQDITLSHLPRFLAVAITLAALGPWMGRQIAAFALRVFAGV